MDGTTPIRPEHSPRGASSAERWMKCPGSVAGGFKSESSEFADEGTLAHEIGARCLTECVDAWEVLADYPTATSEMADAVQVYVDYVRSRAAPMRRWVEHDVEHPAFHKDMYGRLDAALLDPEPGIALETIDYKHGAGVVVEVTDNVQERYYTFAHISGKNWPADLARLDDMARIKLTIVQPRAFHPDGPVRSIVLTAGEIRNWAYNELHPAMQKAGEDDYHMGEHCRFCPRKENLTCPLMRKLATDAALAQNAMEAQPEGVVDTTDEWFGGWYGRLSQLKMFIKAVEGEAKRRAMLGIERPEWKLVNQIVDREWKDGAEAQADMLFGDDIYTPRKFRTPADLEKQLGEAAKLFCAEWAQKPTAGLTIAPAHDKRAAQKVATNEQVFGAIEPAEVW